MSVPESAKKDIIGFYDARLRWIRSSLTEAEGALSELQRKLSEHNSKISDLRTQLAEAEQVVRWIKTLDEPSTSEAPDGVRRI